MAAPYPSSVVSLTVGFFCFPCLYAFLIHLIEGISSSTNGKGDRSVSVAVAVRLVSIIQAICAVAVGYIIITETYQDVIYSRSELVESYASFAVSYMVYDVVGMCLIYREDRQMTEDPARKVVTSFLAKDWILIIHHLAVAFILYPFIMFFRNGKGDFLIGCFFMTELSTPSLNIRKTLLKLKLSDTWIFNINNALFIVTFFVCRVLLFPYMYWAYARNKQLTLYQAMTSMRLVCHVGCASILLLQFMWLSLFIKSITRRRQKYSPSPQKQLIMQEPIVLLCTDKVD